MDITTGASAATAESTRVMTTVQGKMTRLESNYGSAVITGGGGGAMGTVLPFQEGSQAQQCCGQTVIDSEWLFYSSSGDTLSNW